MSRWKRIAVHHSADHDDARVDLADYDAWHRARGWLRIGYHYVVEQIDGRYWALQGRPAFMAGSHSQGENSDTLGVCFAGNFSVETMPHEQLVVGAELVAGLCHMNGIPSANIFRHEDMPGAQTECPGTTFPWVELLRLVRNFLGEEPEGSAPTS